MTDTRGERLQVMLTDEELRALDDWRFQRRMPSRASAVRELLKRGLAAEGFLQADRATRSQDFGVTGAAPSGNGLDEDPLRDPGAGKNGAAGSPE